MTPTTQQLQAVLAAAEAVLDARADGMLTRVEWEALERAVADATGEPPITPPTSEEG